MQLCSLPTKTPEFTSFTAGYLVSENGDWRTVRPVIDTDLCVNCGQCYLYCPDGTISKNLEIDYGFCKGCGICAKVCKKQAIKMEREDSYA